MHRLSYFKASLQPAVQLGWTLETEHNEASRVGERRKHAILQNLFGRGWTVAFEDLEQDKHTGFFLAEMPAKALVFKNDSNWDNLHGWHNAPRRQWCITLAGSVEIGIGDGTKRTFRSGDVFLAEDVTGQGHTATPTDWVRAFIHI